MKKKILLVLSEGFEDFEAVTVIDILTRAGVEVIVAGLVEGSVQAAYGTIILPQTTIEKVDENFDGIVFPGGRKNAQNLALNSRVVELIKKFNSSGKMVAAICAAPSHVLGEAAGILRSKRSTGDPAFNDKLGAAGAIITNQAVTIDGNIITGMGPGAAMEFAFKLVEYLTGREIIDELKHKWRLDKKEPIQKVK